MIIVLMGVSGSGKTTIGQLLAQDLGWRFFDADHFHPLANIEKMRKAIPLDDADRAPWLVALRQAIGACITEGHSAVIACSALKKSYRAALEVDESVKFVYLKASLSLVQSRLASRQGHFFNPALLKDQFTQLEEPEHAFIVDASALPAEIVDVIKKQLGLSDT